MANKKSGPHKKSAADAGLTFGLFSGGKVTIDTARCAGCATQACVKRCVSSTLEPVLKIERGRPVLSRPDGRPEKGWCIECMACELDCSLYGRGAIRIRFEADREREG